MPDPILTASAARLALGLDTPGDLAAALGVLGSGVEVAGGGLAGVLAALGVPVPDPDAALRDLVAGYLRPVAERVVPPGPVLDRLHAEVYRPLAGRPAAPDLTRLRYTLEYRQRTRTPPAERDRAAAEQARGWCEGIPLNPRWVTPTVLALADAIGGDAGFDRLPVLADALEEAGCDDADVLAHCREAGCHHADWCWVIAGVWAASEDGGGEAGGLKHLRRRPGMFIGDDGPDGLHRLLFGVVADALGETAAGHGRAVHVALGPDGSARVEDDGRGLPPHVAGPDLGRLVEAILSGRPSEDERRWFDHAVANALSAWFRIEVGAVGQRYRAAYTRGRPEGDVQRMDAGPAAGLAVAFRPDPRVFGATHFDPGRVRDRLRQAAFLHPGVEVTLTGPDGPVERFRSDGGAADLLRELVGGRPTLHPDVLAATGEDGGVWYDLAFQWATGDVAGVEVSYANGERTPDGGTHLNGLRAAVTRAVNAAFPRPNGRRARVLRGADLREGLLAVVIVRLAEPQFDGSLRSRLANPEAEGVVRAAVERVLAVRFAADPGLAAAVAAQAPPRPRRGG